MSQDMEVVGQDYGELGLSLSNSINNWRVYEIGKSQRKNTFASFLHLQVWHAHF